MRSVQVSRQHKSTSVPFTLSSSSLLRSRICFRMSVTATIMGMINLFLLIVFFTIDSNHALLSQHNRFVVQQKQQYQSNVGSSSGTFLGNCIAPVKSSSYQPSCISSGTKAQLYMRKQKASDKRTRRRQLGDYDNSNILSSSTITAISTASVIPATLTTSPMENAVWNYKRLSNIQTTTSTATTTSTNGATGGGRGRSRKRSNLYNSLAFYHQHFLKYLTMEYQAEEEEVLGRIKSSLDDGTPLGLEAGGYALFDMYIERRGNLFSDEVYRLTKAIDATTTYQRPDDTSTSTVPSCKSNQSQIRYLPSNHKFTNNDVILLTIQPAGSGDFFFIPPAILSSLSSSVAETTAAPSTEARVLNVGPTYMDIVMSPGTFEASFGQPAPNDRSSNGNRSMRLRVDRFFSEIPYQRMVSALSQITVIPKISLSSNPEQQSKTSSKDDDKTNDNNKNNASNRDVNLIRMDEIFREIILSTFATTDPNSPFYKDTVVAGLCNLDELSNKISRPPLGPASLKLTNQVMQYMTKQQSNNALGGGAVTFNGPQRTAIEAALTRRFTMIQGPPGTGKTACAAAIGFGFVHQCRSLTLPQQQHTTKKVIACAFSNIGADNLAESLLKLGLKVVRIGKASAVSEPLWEYTLEAAIDRDADAKKAIQNASRVTSQLSLAVRNLQLSKAKGSSKATQWSTNEQRSMRDAATIAVKASIAACNKAATKALREADVIVSTLTGASDPRLLAACGIIGNDDVDNESEKRRGGFNNNNSNNNKNGDPAVTTAPDGLPPLSLPFVIIDEACQSVEPATLIPIVSSNSCRSLVLLGDPCQLPPTIRSQEAIPNLSLSLMERLASTLHLSNAPPQTKQQFESNDILSSLNTDDTYLTARPIRQAVSSLTHAKSRSSWGEDGINNNERKSSYRKQYNGSFLLSMQYRMHPSIAALPSAIFYDSLLKTPAFMKEVRSFPKNLRKLMPCADPTQCVRVVDVGGKSNERQGMIPSLVSSSDLKYYTKRADVTSYSTTTSSLSAEQQTTYWNEPEAERVISLIKDIITGEQQQEGYVNSIGVITPYNGQVQLIKSMIAGDPELRQMLIERKSVSIEVKSVDGYQGRERDVIIFSAVRSNRHQRIGFLHDWRRMNVALTRAKSALIVVGDLDTLSAADRHWDAFVKWANGVRCVTNDYDCIDDEPST